MATHFNILAWEIPGTEEPGRPWGHRVGRDLVTKQQQNLNLTPESWAIYKSTYKIANMYYS